MPDDSPDVQRRDLERRIAADPQDDAARVALLALDEREGRPPEALTPGQRREILRRSVEEGDDLAQATLERDWASRNRIVEEPSQNGPMVGVFTEAPDADAGFEQVGQRVLSSLPPVGSIMATPHKAPLWDRETFGDGCSTAERYYFRDHRVDAQGRPKSWAHASGPLPVGYQFFLYQFVVLVDAGSDVSQAERLWNDGKVEFLGPQMVTNDWPMRACMLPPRGIPTGLVARTRMIWPLGGVDVTVAGTPITLRREQDWHVRIFCEGLERLPVMIWLRGIRLRERL